MARVAEWYVRGEDGDDRNSGGANTKHPELDLLDLAVDGLLATSRTGGFGTTVARSINIQCVGDNIRLFEVVDDTTVVLSAGLSVKTGVFPARVGGARASLAKVANSTAPNNAALDAMDIIWVQGGVYFEEVDVDLPCALRAFDGKVILDGTGGFAGSSPLHLVDGATLIGFEVCNSVDAGVSGWRPFRQRDMLGKAPIRRYTREGRRGGGMMLEFLGRLWDALRGVEASPDTRTVVSQGQQTQVGPSLQNVVVNASGGDGIALPQVQRLIQGYPSSVVRAAFLAGAFLGAGTVVLVWLLSSGRA
jgi:hypothetical protein